MKEIKINCDAKDYLDLNELTEFQGNLKFRDDEDFNKIVRSILKHGFCFPFFVWKKDTINYVLDGHGRLGAMEKLDELGYKIPSLPVIYVKCKNEKAAKDLLLRLNSFYGRMSKESVMEFVDGLDLDFSDLRLPNMAINFEDLKPFESLDVSESDTPPEKHIIICPNCGKEIEI